MLQDARVALLAQIKTAESDAYRSKQTMAAAQDELAQLKARRTMDRMAADTRLREAVKLAESVGAAAVEEAAAAHCATTPATTASSPPAAAAAHAHPIFGEMLHCFEHKQVFAISPELLTDPNTLPVWKQQRVFQLNRAEKIAKAMTKHDFVCPGAITAVETEDGKLVSVKRCCCLSVSFLFNKKGAGGAGGGNLLRSKMPPDLLHAHYC